MRKLFLSVLLLLALFVGYRKWERITLWWVFQAPQPPWAKEQLAHDFAHFRAITQEALNETFHRVQPVFGLTYRYRIIDGEIFRIGAGDSLGRDLIFEKMLKRIQKSKKLPNVDFLICMRDGVPEAAVPENFWIPEKGAPLFAWARRQSAAPYVVLIPDFLTTKESSWHKEIKPINKKYKQIPWEQRKEIAFWRGVSNDKGYTLENFRQKPRFLISFLAKLHPDLIDAGFCRVYPEAVEHAVKELGLILGYASVVDHLSFKYLPVLDGYMCTFPGFQWRLLSGSVIFKQESDEVQYFYSALKPYEHYVPIKNDMSDLVEKIQWAKEHDDECRKIAINARSFALQNLLPDQIYAYLYWVLETYASLQEFDVKQEALGPQWKKV